MANHKNLLPEECIRQWFLEELKRAGVESYRVATEYAVRVGGRTLRVDVAVFRRGGSDVELIVECKAPSVAITPEVVTQAAVYNSVVGARYIVVTNGSKTFIYDTQRKLFVSNLPDGL